MTSKSQEATSNFYKSLNDFAINSLMGKGLSGDDAEDIAFKLCDDVSEFFGGESIYIPKKRMSRAAQKNAQIIEEFDGTNQLELARKYDYSTAHVYRVIKNANRVVTGASQ